MSGGQRAVLVIVTAVIAVGAFLVLRPEDEDSEPVTRTTTPTETTTTAPEQTQPDRTTPEARPSGPELSRIDVKDGEPVGGIGRIAVKKGEQIRFEVHADAEHEVHLHGYDVSKDVTAEKPARFELEATETGIFEIELEDTKTQIAELKVEP